MKQCPYCNEEIQDVAKKCRFCGEWLESDNKAKASNEDTIKTTSQLTFASFFKGLFQGRISRKNFVVGILFVFIANLIITGIVDTLYNDNPTSSLVSLLGFVDVIVFFILYVSLFVRRLHDTNRSGKKLFWFLLAIVIPLLLFWQIAVIFQKSDSTTNNYGEAPTSKRRFWDIMLNLKRA